MSTIIPVVQGTETIPIVTTTTIAMWRPDGSVDLSVSVDTKSVEIPRIVFVEDRRK